MAILPNSRPSTGWCRGDLTNNCIKEISMSAKLRYSRTATIKLLGNIAEIQNFLRITKINLWSNLATRGRGVNLPTLVDRDAEALQERG